jgi:hypothetical protein
MNIHPSQCKLTAIKARHLTIFFMPDLLLTACSPTTTSALPPQLVG